MDMVVGLTHKRHFYRGDHVDVPIMLIKHFYNRDTVLEGSTSYVPVHRDVIALISPSIRRYYSDRLSGVPIVINMLEPEALKEFVRFAYTGDLELTDRNVRSLLAAAKFTGNSFIEASCREFMRDNIRAHNCIGINRLTENTPHYRLSAQATAYAELYFLDLVKYEQFRNCKFSEIQKLVQSDNLNISSEEDVYDAIMLWIRYDACDRVKYSATLVQNVRLAFVPYHVLSTRIAERVAMMGKVGLQILNNALRYHRAFGVERWKMQDNDVRFIRRKSPGVSKVLYVFGGEARNWRAKSHFSTFEKYDFRRDKWEYVGYLPERLGAGVIAHCNSIWVVGGRIDCELTNNVDIFDLVTLVWHRGPDLRRKRWNLSVAVANGLLFAVGGDDEIRSLSVMEVYDRISGEIWTVGTPMSSDRCLFGLCASGKFLYAVGGMQCPDMIWLQSIESYNVTTEQWTTFAQQMKCGKYGFGIAMLDGLIYVVGGVSGSDQVFNTATGEWGEISRTSQSRIYPAVTSVDGKVYVIGGDGRPAGKSGNTIECYDPGNDRWTPFESHTLKKRSRARVTVIDVQK